MESLMKHLRIIFIVLLGLMQLACTTVNFNQTYANANWKTVAVAPIEGEGASAVEAKLFHKFATNTAIRLIEPETVAAKIAELNLTEAMGTTPVAALVEVSKALGVDGFVYGKVDTGNTQFADTYANYAKLDLRLYSNEGIIVASSVNDASSVFFGNDSNIERATRDTLYDFTEFFEILNSNFE
jgi:hypothetical protein